MESGPASVALVFTGFSVLLAGIWAWTLVAAKAAVTWRLVPESLAAVISRCLVSQGLAPRLPLISWSPRRCVPWAFLDLVVLTGLYIVAGAALHESGLIASGKMETLTLVQKQNVIAANLVLSLGVAAASIALAMIRHGANGSDLGWSSRMIGSDLRLGFIAFVMVAPPVFAIQGVLVKFWKKSEHPIIEMFKDAPDAAFFGLLFVSAAVVAPLFEELIFRVVLQGFLEKVVSFRGSAVELLVGTKTDYGQTSEESTPPQLLPIDDNPYSPPQELTDEMPKAVRTVEEEQLELHGVMAWLPIGVTSAIFALLHFSHGPDWVPLLLLATGMGYLYQRTHRLVPSLTVHALLNAFSMWGLWAQVKAGLEAGG